MAFFSDQCLKRFREIKCFFQGRAGPKMCSNSTSELIVLNQETGEPGNLLIFFFLLNTFPLAWLVFNFVVGSSFLQGKAVLWGRRCPLSSSPLFLHTKDVEKCGIFGPCLCGRFLKKKSCGALEDGSLRVWIILRIIFYTKKFAFLEPNEVFFLIFTRTPEKW